MWIVLPDEFPPAKFNTPLWWNNWNNVSMSVSSERWSINNVSGSEETLTQKMCVSCVSAVEQALKMSALLIHFFLEWRVLFFTLNSSWGHLLPLIFFNSSLTILQNPFVTIFIILLYRWTLFFPALTIVSCGCNWQLGVGGATLSASPWRFMNISWQSALIHIHTGAPAPARSTRLTPLCPRSGCDCTTPPVETWLVWGLKKSRSIKMWWGKCRVWMHYSFRSMPTPSSRAARRRGAGGLEHLLGNRMHCWFLESRRPDTLGIVCSLCYCFFPLHICDNGWWWIS